MARVNRGRTIGTVKEEIGTLSAMLHTALDEDGVTHVFKAGPKYELLGKNTLDGMCMATPAIARDSLIIRTADRLYRIRN